MTSEGSGLLSARVLQTCSSQLFGDDATTRRPIIYAKNENSNPHKLYMGNAAALEAYLRANPRVVDELKIAKLYPGGFVACISIGGKKNSYKQFDFQADLDYCLYTKVGGPDRTGPDSKSSQVQT